MTPISPELALAMNVVANPGVYALLLGSGVSRSAGIPTGWDVVLDLVGKLAVAAGADPEQDPEQWYRVKYDEPPRYSALLEELAPTQAERRSLLKGHFEPTPQQREEGVKTPTDAHRAIADMVEAGWINVIVTTNFDKLLELALENAGVRPVVIAQPDQIEGAPPLAHNSCTVIKVHGDYLDTRIKNSEEELAAYDPAMNALLERVFDEYGLIACGWSGEHDQALRDALGRYKSRRFTTYWCTLGDLHPLAKQVADNRAAQLVTISDADSFFVELEERVTSIQAVGERHPLETRAAVETLKRYLAEDRHRIPLRELVQEATEVLASHLTVEEFPPGDDYSEENLKGRTQRLDALAERPLALMANGCFWGMPEHDDAWVAMVRRLAAVEAPGSGLVVWLGQFRYPALLALYAGGVAAVAAGRYDLVASLLVSTTRSSRSSEPETLVKSLFPHNIVSESAAHILCPNPDGGPYYTPLSLYIERTLRPHFAELIPVEREYAEAFDRFEYLASLVYADLSDSFFCAGGCFEWRREPYGHRGLPEIVGHEIEESGDGWPPLKAGLFGGSLERLREVRATVHEGLRRNPRW